MLTNIRQIKEQVVSMGEEVDVHVGFVRSDLAQVWTFYGCIIVLDE
jgi:hypothetical protein